MAMKSTLPPPLALLEEVAVGRRRLSLGIALFAKVVVGARQAVVPWPREVLRATGRREWIHDVGKDVNVGSRLLDQGLTEKLVATETRPR